MDKKLIEELREKLETEMDLWKMVEDALSAGVSGVSIGRNIFQHENPSLVIKIICRMVHQNLPLEEAIKIMKKK